MPAEPPPVLPQGHPATLGADGFVVDPVLVLLWALKTFWVHEQERQTTHALAVTADFRPCDPVSHDARRFSLVGMLLRENHHRGFRTDHVWPGPNPTFVTWACMVLAGPGVEASAAEVHVEKLFRRLDTGRIAEWVERAFKERELDWLASIEDEQDRKARRRLARPRVDVLRVCGW